MLGELRDSPVVEEACFLNETVSADSVVTGPSSEGSAPVVFWRRALEGGGDALLKEEALRAVSDEKHGVGLGGVRARRRLGPCSTQGGQGEHCINGCSHDEVTQLRRSEKWRAKRMQTPGEGG